MKKLHFLFAIISILSIFACEEDLFRHGCTDKNSLTYDSLAVIDDGSCISMVGCTGYSPEISRYGQVISSFGNANYDQKFAEEVAIQRSFYKGVPANIILIREAESMNAFASPGGDILFGHNLFWNMLQGFGELPVAGVLAHEWGHRTQFTFNWNDYQQPAHREMEADAFSGFYMYLAKQWAWSKVDSYYRSVFASGDYNFNDRNHHGAPEERLAAARLGVETAVYAVQNGYQFSYTELHNLFNNQISNVIKPRSNSEDESGVAYTEIEFPRGVTKDFVKSLYPKK